MDCLSFRNLVETAVRTFDLSIAGILDSSGRVHAVPTESSFLAKIVESNLVQHLQATLSEAGLIYQSGGEREYPDVEAYDPVTGTFFAVDVKCASVSSDHTKFNSRPTLYTFGTYLKYRNTKTGGILRPYDSYAVHLDAMVMYEINYNNPAVIEKCITGKSLGYVRDLAKTYSVFNSLEVCVVESWKVASHLMSSRTRDYVGAVRQIGRFKNEQGVFDTKEAFLAFWEQLPSKNAAVLNQVFGNSKARIPSSHCTIEELADLIGMDSTSMVRRVESDPSFPVFHPDSNSYALESARMPGKLVYPYIAAMYLGLPETIIHNIEMRLHRLRAEQGRDSPILQDDLEV